MNACASNLIFFAQLYTVYSWVFDLSRFFLYESHRVLHVVVCACLVFIHLKLMFKELIIKIMRFHFPINNYLLLLVYLAHV